MRWMRKILAAVALSAFALPVAPARAVEAPKPNVSLASTPSVLFSPTRDGCDGNDVPDAPARMFRDADGSLVLFGLHYTNHYLRGPSLDVLKIVCRSALLSKGAEDPAAYDDKSWIAATWTTDGRLIDGLVHHEYQADGHPGRCRFPTYMQCWFNTVVAVRSADGGASFARTATPVVASAPFPQSVDQGRHRGFFNPSNIFSDGKFAYFMASTTGWSGQEGGVCLFRTATPDVSTSWRAYDGTQFTVRYTDPYSAKTVSFPKPCRTLAPFPAPVGSVVRQRGTGLWLAVFQAAGNGREFPMSGIYAAGSRDLLHWSDPRLVLPGVTNYEDPCRSGGRIIAYPALVDPTATGRNFDDVGSAAILLYASMRVEGCTITSDRVLMRQPVRIGFAP